MNTTTLWRAAAVFGVLAMLTAACGGAEVAGSGSGAGTVAAPGPEAAGLPDLEVLDVGTGAPVELAGLTPGDRPLLVWFWAPH